MLSDATQDQVVRLLKLVDCFEGAEFSQLLMVLEDLGYSTFTRLLTEYPRPKPCHMCSVQREKTDDYLLITDLQKPRQVAQMWHADQDELIQFDLLAEQVRCHGVRIDLANTCRSCLDRITRCLADVGRDRKSNRLTPVTHAHLVC